MDKVYVPTKSILMKRNTFRRGMMKSSSRIANKLVSFKGKVCAQQSLQFVACAILKLHKLHVFTSMRIHRIFILEQRDLRGKFVALVEMVMRRGANGGPIELLLPGNSVK